MKQICVKTMIFCVSMATLFADSNSDLATAVASNDASAVKAAIDAGADVDGWNESNVTSLMVASKSGNLKIMKILIDAKADVNKTDGPGFSPLMEAACSGQYEAVKLLLKHKADVNKRSMAGLTALYMLTPGSDAGCEKKGDKKMIQILKRAGAK